MSKKIYYRSVLKTLADFSEFYSKHRLGTKSSPHIKYRILSTFDDYTRSKLLQLSFTDNPGDNFPPMPIQQIKKMPDLISGLHPIDVNSLNDLYYLAHDKIIEMIVDEESIVAIKEDGSSINYDVREQFNPDQVHSTRLSYMMGYLQAEKLIKDFYQSVSNSNDSYKIVKDHITTLEVVDLKKEKTFLRSPLDILFSGEYQKFSKEDVSKIGYICGQMSQI